MLKIIRLQVGRMQSNCYIIYDEDERKAVIIDAGDDADYIIKNIESNQADPVKIIATHGHFDHNMASYELQTAYNIPYLISEKDQFLIKKMKDSAKLFLGIPSVKTPRPDAFLKKGDKVNIGKSYFKIIDIPGHTPGSIALYNPVERIIFSGDTIFEMGSIGRYDFSYSNKSDLFGSIEKIMSLPKETLIYPGHGEVTSVKNELYYHN
jgi:hydroxyacylglutathione hydrolase